MLSNLLNYWLFIKKVSGEISTDAFSLFLKSFCFTFPLRRINFMWKGSIVFLLVSELKAVCFEVISVPVQEILWILVFAEAWSMPLFGLHFLPFRASFLFTFSGGEKEIKVNRKDMEITIDSESKSYPYRLLYTVILPTLSCIFSTITSSIEYTWISLLYSTTSW